MNEVSRKEKEIIVKAPFLRRVPEKIPDLERLRFFETCGKVGGYLSGFIVLIGSLLCLFSSYHILTLTDFSLHQPFFIDAIGFLGVMNFLCGLFLLAKE